jgi:hypothetical protein
MEVVEVCEIGAARRTWVSVVASFARVAVSALPGEDIVMTRPDVR